MVFIFPSQYYLHYCSVYLAIINIRRYLLVKAIIPSLIYGAVLVNAIFVNSFAVVIFGFIMITQLLSQLVVMLCSYLLADRKLVDCLIHSSIVVYKGIIPIVCM